MKQRHAILGFVITFCVFSPCDGFGQDLREKLTSVMEQQKNKGFNGQVVVRWGGQNVLNTAVGISDPTAERPVSVDSLFYIGSVAKVITSATALQLSDEGLLNLDASLKEYLPGLPSDKHGITIRHLLAHQSGLPPNHDKPLQMLSRDEFVTWVLRQKLSFEPGKGWAYSNVGYSLLAAVIEHVAEGSFQDVVRDRVLSKAKMNSTFFLDELDDQRRPLLTVGKGPMCEEFNLSGRIDDFESTWLRYGPGAMVSSATDLAKLCEAIKEGRVYNANALKLATTPVRDGWGLGWRLSQTRKRTPLQYHDGGFAGFHSLVALMPSENAFVIVLSNQEKGAEPVAKALLDVLMTHSP